MHSTPPPLKAKKYDFFAKIWVSEHSEAYYVFEKKIYIFEERGSNLFKALSIFTPINFKKRYLIKSCHLYFEK